MRGREHPCRASMGKGCGPGDGAGLVQENLEVTIKIHAMPMQHQDSRVPVICVRPSKMVTKFLSSPRSCPRRTLSS